MTIQTTGATRRPLSPARRARQRLVALRQIDRGALSAEFAVLMCVGAGMAFLMYSQFKNGGIARFIVDIVKGLLGGLGGLG